MKKQGFVDELTFKGVTVTWISTVLLALLHLFTSFNLTSLSCERFLVVFNATCAAIVLLFGSITCVATSLGIPLKRQILNRVGLDYIKDNHYLDLLAVFGVISFASLTTFTPLIGFYKAISASRCRDLRTFYYYSTVALNCLDIFFMSCVTWALMRRKDFESFNKNVKFNNIKLRLKKK